MKLPADLNLIDATNFAYNWPAAMDFVIKNVTLHEAEKALEAFKLINPRSEPTNGPFGILLSVLKGTKKYETFSSKASKSKAALVAELKELLPRFVGVGEADGSASYLILDKSNIIGLGDYQPTVRTLEDMEMKMLAAAIEEPMEFEMDMFDYYEPYIDFFAGALGIRIPKHIGE